MTHLGYEPMAATDPNPKDVTPVVASTVSTDLGGTPNNYIGAVVAGPIEPKNLKRGRYNSKPGPFLFKQNEKGEIVEWTDDQTELDYAQEKREKELAESPFEDGTEQIVIDVEEVRGQTEI